MPTAWGCWGDSFVSAQFEWDVKESINPVSAGPHLPSICLAVSWDQETWLATIRVPR